MERAEAKLEAAAARGDARSISTWLIRVLGGCLLVALASQVRVPLPGTPVPSTLQLLAVLSVGFWLRPSEAISAMVLYIGLGSAGLPVFTAGSLGLWGVTGGYIVGFLAAAGLMSVLGGGLRTSFGRLLAIGAVGTAIVFLFGVAWGVLFWGSDPVTAIRLGVAPFALKAVVELLAAAVAVVALRGVR